MFLKRLFRYSSKYYIAAVIIGTVVAALSVIRTGIYRLAWMDALTSAGAVLFFLGLLSMVSHCGGFDIFRYSFSVLGGRRHYKNLYEYTQAKKEKRYRDGWIFMPFITVGTVFIISGILVRAL